MLLTMWEGYTSIEGSKGLNNDVAILTVAEVFSNLCTYLS